MNDIETNIDNLYNTLDDAYSSIGSAMCSVDKLPEDMHANIAAKAKELLRLAQELQSLIEGEQQ